MRNEMKLRATVALLAFAAVPVAQAHVLGVHGAGFTAGLAHPFLGADHLLAMIAVGLWAGQMGGRALWGVPLAFVAMMVLGALLALAGIPLPVVQTGIATSLLVLGLLVGITARLPAAASMLLVGAFAVFHGHAHASELPQALSPALYGLGFVIATALLHAVGVWLGRLPSQRAVTFVRAAGFAVAGSGVLMLVG
jgi:urease accessory protein